MLIYVWLAITLIALIIEFCTADMVSCWFAGGGLVALVLSAFELSWIIQLVSFIIVSAVLLLCFRKVVMKKINPNIIPTNTDMQIGKEYRLLSSIGLNQSGSIKINDVVWSVDTEQQSGEIEKGALVKIIAVRGNKYIVEEVK